MNTLELPGCIECGACCFSKAERYVRVRGDDYSRLGEAAAMLVHWVGNEAYLKMRAGHCTALRVGPGRHFCSIYEERPQTCRDFGRGSPACEAERMR
jgi:uncharacterized protein